MPKLGLTRSARPPSRATNILRNLGQPATTARWLAHQWSRRTNKHYLVTMNHGGTHWIRLQIALYLESYFGLQTSKDDLKRFEIIPPMHRKQFLFAYNSDRSVPRVQQTHAPYSGHRFNRRASVILLVRDLRDCLISYFTTVRERSARNLEFSDFLRGRNLPPQERYVHTLGRRINFLNSWARGRHRIARLKLVHFEAMREKPADELAAVVRF